MFNVMKEGLQHATVPKIKNLKPKCVYLKKGTQFFCFEKALPDLYTNDSTDGD